MYRTSPVIIENKPFFPIMTGVEVRALAVNKGLSFDRFVTDGLQSPDCHSTVRDGPACYGLTRGLRVSRAGVGVGVEAAPCAPAGPPPRGQRWTRGR